jgi:hypothetical protein
VPPRGFEPLVSTLKGWRPWPLDDGGAPHMGLDPAHSVEWTLLTTLLLLSAYQYTRAKGRGPEPPGPRFQAD